MQLSAGNSALVNEAVQNVLNRATRQSTKMLAGGAVSVYRLSRVTRVIVSVDHESETGTVEVDGTVTWDKAAQ